MKVYHFLKDHTTRYPTGSELNLRDCSNFRKSHSSLQKFKMPPAPTDRAALTARKIPHMTLSDGTSSSLTGPPAPIPPTLDAEGRAQLRFAVKGNAIVTGGAGTLGLAATRALLEHGLSGVMIFDVNPEQIELALTELTEEFPSATIGARIVDITDDVAITNAVAETVEVLGSIDVLL